MPATETFYDVALRRLSEQLDQVDKLDAKVAAVFSSSAAILPIFGALLALFGKSHPKGAVGLYIAALGVYVLLLAFSAFAYRVGGWSFRPDPETLWGISAAYDDPTVRYWVATECVASMQENQPRLRRKANLVSVGIALLALDAVLLSVAAAVLLA
jgi:hypothetical protein